MFKLRDCKCEYFQPFMYATYFLGFKLCNTVMCVTCGRLSRGFTYEKAIVNWNRKMGGCEE